MSWRPQDELFLRSRLTSRVTPGGRRGERKKQIDNIQIDEGETEAEKLERKSIESWNEEEKEMERLGTNRQKDKEIKTDL
jgi:hypothetical protein